MTEKGSNFEVAIRIKPFRSVSHLETKRSCNDEVSQEQNKAFKTRNLITSMTNREFPQIYPIAIRNKRKDEYDAIECEGQTLELIDDEFNTISSKEQFYCFNSIFNQNTSNEKVFRDTVAPKLDKILQENTNLAIMAYGITGAGKTHTIFGENSPFAIDTGICNYSIEYLLKKINSPDDATKFELKCSYYEIYNEQIVDLLSEFYKSLQVLDDIHKGAFIPGLVEIKITTIEDFNQLIAKGNLKRALSSTDINQHSSRSHIIVQLQIENGHISGKQQTFYSKVNIVDLAGSEKVFNSERKGQGSMETVSINKSLLTLEKCINLQSNHSKRDSIIPYRNSKLTRVLKDSILGHGQNIIIACISPSSLVLEDTANTLNFASRLEKFQRKKAENTRQALDSRDYVDSNFPLSLQLKLKNSQKQFAPQTASCPNCNYKDNLQASPKKCDDRLNTKITENKQDTDLTVVTQNHYISAQSTKKVELDNEVLKELIESHKEGLKNFSLLPQTQEKLSFIKKVLEPLELNFSKQEKIRKNIKEIGDSLYSIDYNIAELKQRLCSATQDKETINELQVALMALQSQQKNDIHTKHELNKELEKNLNQNSQLQSELINTIMEYLLHIQKLELENYQLQNEIRELKISNGLFMAEKNSSKEKITNLQEQISQLESELNASRNILKIKQQQPTEIESLAKGINATSSTETSNSVSKTPVAITPTNLKNQTRLVSNTKPALIQTTSKEKPSITSLESSSTHSAAKITTNPFFHASRPSPKLSPNGNQNKRFAQTKTFESKMDVSNVQSDKRCKKLDNQSKKNQLKLNIAPLNEHSQIDKRKRTPDSLTTRVQLTPQDSRANQGNELFTKKSKSPTNSKTRNNSEKDLGFIPSLNSSSSRACSRENTTPKIPHVRYHEEKEYSHEENNHESQQHINHIRTEDFGFNEPRTLRKKLQYIESFKNSDSNEFLPDKFLKEENNQKLQEFPTLGEGTKKQGVISRELQENLQISAREINQKINESISNPLDSFEIEKNVNNSVLRRAIETNKSIADENPMESCSDTGSLKQEENSGLDSPLISTTSKTIYSALKKPSRKYLEIDDL